MARVILLVTRDQKTKTAVEKVLARINCSVKTVRAYGDTARLQTQEPLVLLTTRQITKANKTTLQARFDAVFPASALRQSASLLVRLLYSNLGGAEKLTLDTVTVWNLFEARATA